MDFYPHKVDPWVVNISGLKTCTDLDASKMGVCREPRPAISKAKHSNWIMWRSHTLPPFMPLAAPLNWSQNGVVSLAVYHPLCGFHCAISLGSTTRISPLLQSNERDITRTHQFSNWLCSSLCMNYLNYNRAMMKCCNISIAYPLWNVKHLRYLSQDWLNFSAEQSIWQAPRDGSLNNFHLVWSLPFHSLPIIIGTVTIYGDQSFTGWFLS